MVTNFFPIEYEFEEFQIARLDYSDFLYKELKDTYAETHAVFRDGTFLYISSFNDSEELKIGELVTLKVNDNSRVFSSLVKHTLNRVFTSEFKDIRVTNQFPLRFRSRNIKHDLLFELLPPAIKGKLAFKKQVEIDLRKMKVSNEAKWGTLINSEYKWEFNISCKDLNYEGYSLEKMEVVYVSSDLHSKFSFIKERLIGRINQVISGKAFVETNNGIQTYDLNDLFPHKSSENVKKYLEFKIGEDKAQRILDTIKFDSNRFNAKSYFTDILATAKFLSQLNYQNADGFSFRINPTPNSNLIQIKQENPPFIFSIDGYKTYRKANDGLNESGPYDSLIMDVKRPKILVVCHRQNRGAFSTFLAKLKNGIPGSIYFSSGILQKYRLLDIEFVIEEINDYTINTYTDVIQKAIRFSSSTEFDLALIETKSEWKTFAAENNPYYHVKAYLMSIGIPVQLITNDNARKNDVSGILLNTLALQIYAKLGGTPWVIPANSNIDHEIIVGIGSATYRANSFANSNQFKVVGISTFFSSDGRYLFGNKCRDVLYEHYFEELLVSLRSSIDELSNRDGWRHGDTVRIIFHVFKPIKNIEANVVEQLIKSYKNFIIKFAFITVSDSHPFMVFDERQAGLASNSGYKGQFLPTRGDTVVVSESSCLIQMKGPGQIKTIKQGISRPLYIKIHENSTFKDLFYISQQIYNFTNLSWRSFLPAQLPVTIYYSDLIANLLLNLSQIKGWKSEGIINGPIKYKKWFL